jgi:hypothetical protein
MVVTAILRTEDAKELVFSFFDHGLGFCCNNRTDGKWEGMLPIFEELSLESDMK